MKQYYIYVGNEQSGPFTIDILKDKQIKSDTLIWHEGLLDWQKASEIDDLKILLSSATPPIKKVNTPPVIPNIQEQQIENIPDENSQPNKILGIRKNIFIYSVLCIAFIICISAFSNYNKKEKLEENFKKQQLETYNQQLKEQQDAIEKQNIRIAEQEKLERERKEKEKLQRINEITDKLAIAHQNLEKAKKHLHDATAFQLLRSSSERHQQVSAAEETVKLLETEIATLEAEMKELNK
jgi:hypothetical protein